MEKRCYKFSSLPQWHSQTLSSIWSLKKMKHYYFSMPSYRQVWIAHWVTQYTGTYTHTFLYLHVESDRYTAQQWEILPMVVHCVMSICNADSLQAEMRYPKQVFRRNWYSNQDITQDLNSKISCRHWMENLPFYPCYHTGILLLTKSASYLSDITSRLHFPLRKQLTCCSSSRIP